MPDMLTRTRANGRRVTIERDAAGWWWTEASATGPSGSVGPFPMLAAAHASAQQALGSDVRVVQHFAAELAEPEPQGETR